MALIVKDRVKETTTTTGTGTITLAGASTGFRSFADIGNANTTYYCISGGSQFEVGLGTYTASGTTLSRDTVLSNSLGTTALINFSAGTKDVFVTYPSDKALLGSTSSVSSTGTGSVVLNTAPTIAGGATIDATTQDINIGTSQTSGTLNIGTNTARTSNIYIGQNANNSYGISVNNFNSGTQTAVAVGQSSQSSINIGVEESESAVASTVSVYGDVTIGDATKTTVIRGGLSLAQTLTGTTANLTNTFTLSGTALFTGALSMSGVATNNQTFATSQTTGSLNIGGTGAATGAINIGSGTGGQTISIANATSGAKTLNIASGASSATKTLSIGASGTGTTNITIGATGGTSTTTLNGNIILSKTATPASATATGTAGTIVWDANYIYICTATNTWKRVAISTW